LTSSQQQQQQQHQHQTTREQHAKLESIRGDGLALDEAIVFSIEQCSTFQ